MRVQSERKQRMRASKQLFNSPQRVFIIIRESSTLLLLLQRMVVYASTVDLRIDNTSQCTVAKRQLSLPFDKPSFS